MIRNISRWNTPTALRVHHLSAIRRRIHGVAFNLNWDVHARHSVDANGWCLKLFVFVIVIKSWRSKRYVLLMNSCLYARCWHLCPSVIHYFLKLFCPCFIQLFYPSFLKRFYPYFLQRANFLFLNNLNIVANHRFSTIHYCMIFCGYMPIGRFWWFIREITGLLIIVNYSLTHS